MIRLILIAIFVILYHILGLPVLGILWIWGKFNKPASDLASLRIVQWAFRVILFLAGTEITVIGEEHVPKDQAVLYIANHQSYFDIVLTYARCPNLTGFVAKDSIQKIPILPIWMRRLYCLFLNRDDIREGMKTILMPAENRRDLSEIADVVKENLELVFVEDIHEVLQQALCPLPKGKKSLIAYNANTLTEGIRA